MHICVLSFDLFYNIHFELLFDQKDDPEMYKQADCMTFTQAEHVLTMPNVSIYVTVFRADVLAMSKYVTI